MDKKDFTPDISICIATYQRPQGLRRLLASLHNQTAAAHLKCEIIIVDNDVQGSGKPALQITGRAEIPLKYSIEPRQNISHARNKALQLARGKWLAFIDDDEEAERDWLANFWQMSRKISAAGFFGPVLPQFESDVRHWLKGEDCFQRPRPADGARLTYAQTRTSNAFIRRECLAPYRFDPAFGRLGGSDVELFARMQNDGHLFFCCDGALVREYFPCERVNIRWLLRRAFRGGLSYTKIRKKLHSGKGQSFNRFFKSTAGIVVFSLILPFESLLGRRYFVRRLQKILVQTGHLCGIFNVKFEEYRPKRNATRIKFIFNVCTHYRRKLFEELAKKYDIEFLFFSAGDENYYDGLGSKALGEFDGRYLKGLKLAPHLRLTPGLLPLIFRRKSDIIIKCINDPLPLLLSFVAAKIHGLPFILWTGLWHDLQTRFHKAAWPLVDFIYKKSDAIVVYGDHVTHYLRQKSIDRQKIFPAYQAHDTTLFLHHFPAAEIEKLRSELGIRTAKVILFIGRLVEEKGLETLLAAFSKLDPAEVSLLIIGAGKMEEKLRTTFKNEVNGLLLPYVENAQLYKYYALADVFVLPSITTGRFKEPWGFVVNEAMCQSCAIVLSDAVGAGQGGLIQHEINGLIFPEKDSSALAKILDKLLHDEKYCRNLQHKALQSIKNWPLEKSLAGFDAAIEFALNRKQNSN